MNLIFLPIQILLLAFLFFAFTRVILRFREGTISLGMFLFWAGFWILASIGIIKPDFTTFVAKKIGIGRGADAVIYASLLILFYLIFRLSVALENLRHEVTKIIRELALRDTSVKKTKSKK
jgi:hypothetical protein